MSSSKDVAAKIAKARLTEKLHRVNDAQTRLHAHVSAIEKTRQELSSCSGAILSKTEATFKELQIALTRRKASILERIKERLVYVTNALSTRKEQCEALGAETDKIIKTASEVMEGHQSKLIRQYSTVSQLMEDTFISSLMLLDESGIRTLRLRIESANECDLDCSSLLMELDAILGPVDALVSEFGSVIETVNDNEPLPVYSRDVTASPACFRLPDSSERSVSSLSLHTEQDMLSTTWEPANDACLGSVPYLQPGLGELLEVMVTMVSELDQFTAQLYGQEIVLLSQQLRECISDEPVDPSDTITPVVGEYYCSLFPEDQCWYRSRVISVNDDTSTATVVYIDYGNREEVPFSMIRPLPTQLSSLPAQALTCFLHKLELPSSTESELISSIFQWLSAVLVGARCYIIVSAVRDYDDVQAEAYVPISLLSSVQSLGLLQRLLGGEPPSSCLPTGLPSSVPLTGFIKKLYEHYSSHYDSDLLHDDQTTPIPPSPAPSPPITPCSASFMSQPSQWPNLQDLAVTPSQLERSHQNPTNGWSDEASKQMVSENGENLTKQSVSRDSTPVTIASSEHSITEHTITQSTPVLHKKSQHKDEKTLESADQLPSSNSHDDAYTPLTKPLSITPLTISNLQPIQLSLNVSDQINILVSHAINPMCVFVHPVLSGAQDLLQLETSLNEFYSEPSHCVSLPANFVNRGNLCCVQSHDDKLWYRAVVSESFFASSPPASLPSSVVAVKRVQLYCVDYGHTLTVPASAPVVLDPSFVTTPIQCFCCSLDGIKPPVLTSPLKPTVQENGCTSNTQVLQSETLHQSVPSNGEHLTQGSDSAQVTQLLPPLLSGEWDKAAAELLLRVTGEKQLVGTVTQYYGSSSELHQPVFSMLLYDTTGESDVLINQLLVDEGLAERIIPVTNSPSTCQSSPGIGQWDPMQEDFLSSKNCYTYDDEDAGCVLTGYKGSQMRVCRYFAATGTCKDGDQCRFQHLMEGVSDRVLQQTYSIPGPSPPPTVGSFIAVVVTAIASHMRFYVHVLGNVASLDRSDPSNSVTDLPASFIALVENMDQFYQHQVHEGQDSVYVLGELVAAYNSMDDHWYRATITQQLDKDFEVFYVDVGYGSRVDVDKIRKISQEFTILPVQAVQCSLDSDEAQPVSADQLPLIKERFESEVSNKVLVANVTIRSQEYVLYLKLYDTANNKDGVLLNHRIMYGEDQVCPQCSPSCQLPPCNAEGVITLPG